MYDRGILDSTDGRARGAALAIANPKLGLKELDRVDCEESLLEFIQLMWPILEPARPFVRGYVIDAICDHLQAVSDGHIKKLLINVPPGCMKSLTTNVFFPAWEWGPRRNPALRYIGASYSQALTLRDNRRCRQLIASDRYQELWGDVFQISPDQDTKGKFETTARGWKIATSVGGAVVGERGDRFIIDDPHNIKVAESKKVRDSTLQWFAEVVPTRVNDPEKSSFVVIMQRVHENDVSGLIISTELGYDHLCLPMEYESDHPNPSRTFLNFQDKRTKEGELLWPERFSKRYLDETLKPLLRSWGGSYAEAGQLQQRPAPRGGGMFKKEWWRFFQTNTTGYKIGRPAGCNDLPAEPLPDRFDWLLVSVDAAFKDVLSGSRVSIQAIAGKGANIFVLDNKTDHMTFGKTVDTLAIFDDKNKLVGGMIHKWKARKTLIEDKANGPAIISTLRNKVSGIIPVNPQGGKESRGSAVQPIVESGNVYIPDGAPWAKDFVDEFAVFPVGTKNDQVDSFTQAVIYMNEGVDTARARMLGKW